MAISAVRQIQVVLAGDLTETMQFPAVQNSTSPASDVEYLLASGVNTITVPAGGSSVKAMTIRPPALNTFTITLKGVSGDTGIPLSKLDPTSIAFDTAPATIVLTTNGIISGLRILWS